MTGLNLFHLICTSDCNMRQCHCLARNHCLWKELWELKRLETDQARVDLRPQTQTSVTACNLLGPLRLWGNIIHAISLLLRLCIKHFYSFFCAHALVFSVFVLNKRKWYMQETQHIHTTDNLGVFQNCLSNYKQLRSGWDAPEPRYLHNHAFFVAFSSNRI